MNTYATRLPKFIFLFLLFLLASYTKADTPVVKGTYYIRVTTLTVDSIPLCTYSTATTVLSGGGAFKRMCRYAGVYSITRPFNGLAGPTGLGDTLSRYFRIDFSDTAEHDEFMDSLLSLPYTEVVEALPEMTDLGTFSFPNDKYATQQWHLEKIKASQAHDYSTGSGIIIAVVDDAFDMNHEDLKASYYINTVEKNGVAGVDDDGNGYTDDIYGWDASDNDGDPNNYGTTQTTMKYHGTMVTGVISATTNNIKGIASVAPDVKIIPIKVSSDSFLYNPFTHPLEGLAYAINSPAQIINLSWGGEMRDILALPSIMHLLIQAAALNGQLVVVAAGNGAKPFYDYTNCIDQGRGNAALDPYHNWDTVRIYPAAFAEVLSVGATSFNDQKACFSDYGTMSNVDVMAPGEDIYSTFPFNDYVSTSGTSFAAPLTAGICALVWSTNLSMSKYAVADQVKFTADNIGEINENIATKIGSGRVNALDAVLNNQVKASFKVDRQSDCDSQTFIFTAISYPGYTYEWNFHDSAFSATGGAIKSHKYILNVIAPAEYLFDVTLTVKDAFGAVVATLTRKNYILISRCSANKINNKQNQWVFANSCAVEFKTGIAKQSPQSSNLLKIPQLANFSIMHRNNSNVIDYVAAADSVSAYSSYSASFWFKDTYNFGYWSKAYIDHYSTSFSAKKFNMYAPHFNTLQGEFFKIDNKRTMFISNYDTNSTLNNIGMRYAIVRDSIYNSGGSYPYIYVKDAQRGIPIAGPGTPPDFTNDGAIRIHNGMCFIPKCDSLIWMIVRGKEGTYADSLLVYLINTRPSLFSIAFQKAYYCPPLFATDIIRANRYGTQIVCASERDSNIVIFDFKRSTGKLTLRHSFGLDYRFKLAPVFSKNGNILYLVDWQGLKQINLDYKNPKDNIVNLYNDNYLKNRSDFWLTQYSSWPKNPTYGIQLGPDGRVYTNFPSDMYPQKRLGLVANADKFFYNTYGNTRENYLPVGMKFNSYTSPTTVVSTYHGMTDYQHASECASLPTQLFSTFVDCDVVRLYTNSCSPLKKWYYFDSLLVDTVWRSADEYLVYLDSFPANGVIITMIDGLDTIRQILRPQVLPPGALTASASSTCSREVPVNYKYSHSVLTQTDLFVKNWSVTGGEIFRYLGDSAVDVQWNGDGLIGTLQSIVIHPLSGCSDTTLFTILKKPPVKIKNYDPFGPWRYDSAFISYNSTFYLTIADTGYRPIYTTYKWFKDGVKLNYSDTTTRILIIEPGLYWIVADGPCGPDTSNKIVVVVTCDTSNNINGGLITGFYSGATLTINGKVSIGIPHTATFDNCVLFMKDSASFEVPALDSLYFINTKIIGCKTWKGIRAIGTGLPRPGGNCGFVSMVGSSIENAIIALSAEGGGEIHTDDCRFINNEMHIAYDAYPYSNNTFHINNSYGQLKSSTCSCSHPLSLPLKETNPMVYCEGVKDVSIVISSFQGKNTYGISNLSNIEAQTVSNVDMQNLDFYSEADYGIYIKNDSNSMISGNLFNDQNLYQPLINQGEGSTKTGLYAKNCERLLIGTANTFWCCDKGMEWYADALYDTSFVLENTFKGCNNGILYGQQVNPRTNTNGGINTDTSYRITLNFNCNLFERDSMGLVGSGKLLGQGIGIGKGRRNVYVDNINWDIAPQNFFAYTRYNTGLEYWPNNASALILSLVSMNNTQNIGYHPFNSTSSSPNPCTNGFFVHKDPKSEQVIIPFSANLFPNPINNKVLYIHFSDIPVSEIKLDLYNSIGQKMQSITIPDKEYTMDMQRYAPGMYYIKMNNNTFRGTYKLILK